MFLALVAGQAQADNHSSTIALNKSETQLLNINQDSHSVSVFKVNLGANNANALKKLAEIQVGFEPQCVTIKPDDSEAYVTTADGNVSVISLAEGDDQFSVVKKIAVGTEPRGCALTPTGNVLYVANHTSGTVSIINTADRKVAKTVTGFNRPYAVAISDDGDGDDTDETIFVSDFLAEASNSDQSEGFDTGKRGVIRAFPFGLAVFLKKNYLIAVSGFWLYG
ncbi:YncE family protein [Methylocucumis oryzae]|uniref:YncE family protein n=1 Tax=Methylocucumis oryzae TaxID=1632867 RepID=UPI0006967FDD|nr:YncE family protein [Methylocucumis oryzae]